ncbi:MAG: hypothetical protein ACRDGA_13065 [Bacteroidota bacterium]
MNPRRRGKSGLLPFSLLVAAVLCHTDAGWAEQQRKKAETLERKMVLTIQPESPEFEVWFSSREKELPTKVSIPAEQSAYEIDIPPNAKEFRVKRGKSLSEAEPLPRRSELLRYEIEFREESESGLLQALGVRGNKTTITVKKMK